MSERNADGTYKKGASGNPGGRPSKARELAYLAVLREALTLDDWRAIVAQAKADALTTGFGEGEGATRDKARRFLAEYTIGKPAQTLHVERGDGGAFDEYDDLSDDELRAIIANEESSASRTG